MGIIGGLAAQDLQAQKAAQYDNLQAQAEAKYMADLMQNDGFQKGLAAARANAPVYAANDELAYAKAMDAANYRAPVQPPYGAGVAPTGDVSTNGARLAPASDAQANVANQATQNWLDQYRKNKGQ